MKRLLPILILLCGCGAPKKRVQVEVPASCASVKITDFTKPCQPINSTSAVCNGVIIHMSCVRYK